MKKKGSIFINGLEGFINDHCVNRPFSIMGNVEKYAKDNNIPILSPMSGQILVFLLKNYGINNVLELGTGIGFSTLWMIAAKTSIHITTIDRNPNDLKIAQNYIEQTKSNDQTIEYINGQCLEFCITKDINTYDFIFIDCDKITYPDLLEYLILKTKPNCKLLFDNVLWHGRVMITNQNELKPSDVAIQSFWKKLHDKKLEFTLFPSGDGMLLMERKS